jgi:hypothetical protein
MKWLYLTTLIVSSVFASAMAEHPDDAFSADRIAWSSATLKAKKLFLAVEVTIGIDVQCAENLVEELIEPGEGKPVDPGPDILDLTLVTDGFGRHTEVSLLLNPENGAAIQRTSTDSGSKQRFRIYRFTDAGAYHRTRWPLKDETDKPPEHWSERTENLRPYPPAIKGQTVTSATGLIYVAAASGLTDPGDQLEILTFARGDAHRVTMEVAPTIETSVKYRETSAAESRDRNENIPALRILIRGEPIAGTDTDDEFELLGLKGDIELLLDPESRLPLALSGNVKIMGHVTFRLNNATLRSGQQ